MANSDDSSEFEKTLRKIESDLDEDPLTQGLPQDFLAGQEATRKFEAPGHEESTSTFPDNEFGRNAATSLVNAVVGDPTDAETHEPDLNADTSEIEQAPQAQEDTNVFERTPEESARAMDDLAHAILDEADFEVETQFFERLYASEAEVIEQIQQPRIDDVISGIYRVESIRRDGIAYAVMHMGVHEHFELRLLSGVEPGSSKDLALRDVSKRASVLGHDHLGFVTDIGFSSRFGAFAVSELIRGEPIDRFVEQGEQLRLDEALGFMRQIGGALTAMHEVGLVHGMYDSDATIQTRGGSWKLTRAGFPASTGTSDHLAPEIREGGEPTALSDQYALASMLYALLVGVPPEGAAFTPSELRSDLPEEIDAVVLTALAADPSQRHANIDDFQDGVQRAVKVWRTPTVDPVDAREAVQDLNQAAVLKPRKSSSFKVADPRPRSVLVRVEDLDKKKIEVEMVFTSATRLRREYMRNISAAGMFLPMANPPPPPQDVLLTIKFEPSDSSIQVGASLVSQTAGSATSPSGAGLVFSATQHEEILAFLRGLNLGLGIKPTDVIVVHHVLSSDDDLTPGEAFLMSRLASQMTVGMARGSFTGLPFDFDDALISLIDRKFIETLGPAQAPAKVARKPSRPKVSLRPQGRTPRAAAPGTLSTQEFSRRKAERELAAEPKPEKAPSSLTSERASTFREATTPSSEPRRATPRQGAVTHNQLHVSPDAFGQSVFEDKLGGDISLASASVAFERFQLSQEDEVRILEVVAYFEGKKNYISAIDVLERALEQDTKRPRLHHQLAVLRARFQNDLVQAVNSINRALKLDPKNSEFADTRRYIKSLQDIEAQRPIYQQSLPTAKIRFIRVAPELGRIWVEVTTTVPKKDKRIFAVDYQRLRLHAVTAARSPESMSAVPGNHPRLLAFDRRVPTGMATIRERRLKLLEIARAASDYGPWFREGSQPVAYTESSNYLVVKEIPGKLERALYLVNSGSTSQPLRLDVGASRSHSPCFSVDEDYVAWVTTRPKKSVWIAPCLQLAVEAFEPESDVAIGWGADGGLYIVEKTTGKLVVTSPKGGARELAELGHPVDGFVRDPEFLTGLFYGVTEDSTQLIWVRLKSGKILSEYTVPYRLNEFAVREDGLAFGIMEEGCVGIDMKRKRHHALTDVRIAPGSAAQNTWQVGQPLIVLSDAPETLEVLALNVLLLVNS